jgi:hypothetical protein
MKTNLNITLILVALMILTSMDAMAAKPSSQEKSTRTPYMTCAQRDEFSKVEVFVYPTAQSGIYDLEIRDYVDNESKLFRPYFSKNMRKKITRQFRKVEVLNGTLQDGSKISLAQNLFLKPTLTQKGSKRIAAMTIPRVFSRNVPMECTTL